VQSSNPVLTRLGQAARQERVAPGGYGVYPYAPPTATRAMTLDDVVVRTVALLLVTGIVGALSWAFLTDGPLMGLAILGSSIAGLVLVLVISFARITNPLLIVAYAALQGVLLGVVSRLYEERFSGIVVQAVAGTFAVFAVMAVLYKFRVLRATPKFTRFVIGALIGIVALSLINWVAAIFHHNLGLVDYNIQGQGKVAWTAILFSLAAVAVAALTFILDFDAVEQGVRYGLPERYAWYCAFGLLVGLIFLYWQILRLLGYARR
jgi:uncharacterized YccA/Bax inhibitor family protein